jgi:hypothetical protein
MTETLTITYDGPALEANAMDVRELAPALLAIGELIDASNKLLNGDRSAISVKVRAVKPGSFNIDFQLVETLYQKTIDLLSNRDVQAIGVLLAYLGLSAKDATVGLFALLKSIKGRVPKSIVEFDGQVRLELEGDPIVILREVFELYRNVKVREAAEQVLQPLRKPGIDTFLVNENQKEIVHVTKEELPFFAVSKSSAQQETIVTERQAWFSIAALAFKEDNKWRLSDGEASFYVKIADEEFLGHVDRSEISFSKGDLLKVSLKTTQTRGLDGLHTEHEITKVIEHKSAAKQVLMDFTVT